MRGENPGLAAVVKRIRNELGFTQGQLAAKAGVSRSYISLLEIGRVGRPSAQRMLRLAEALRVDVEELYQAAGYKRKAQIDIEDPRVKFYARILAELPERDREIITATIDAALARKHREREEKRNH